MEILVNLDYMPALDKLPDGSYKITVSAVDGVPINTLKIFQDNNAVTCKAVVVSIT